MSKEFNRALKLIEAAKNSAKTRDGAYRCEEITLCSGYAEPGYSDPSSECIAFGNWNTITKYDAKTRESVVIDDIPKRLCAALEKLGVEIEWHDEWACCGGCQKAVRTTADCYQWKRSYTDEDGEIVCVECINPADYLEKLEGSDTSCSTLDNVDPADHNYTRVDMDFENGFHPGQAADPKRIAKALRLQGIARFLFTLDDVGQFDIHFSVWIHAEDFDKFDEKTFGASKLDFEKSPAQGLQEALTDASVKMAALPDNAGVKYAACDSGTGTAEVRVISAQDFIEGKAFKK